MQCSYNYMITITKKLNLIHSYNEITTKIFYIFIADDYIQTYSHDYSFSDKFMIIILLFYSNVITVDTYMQWIAEYTIYGKTFEGGNFRD